MTGTCFPLSLTQTFLASNYYFFVTQLELSFEIDTHKYLTRRQGKGRESKRRSRIGTKQGMQITCVMNFERESRESEGVGRKGCHVHLISTVSSTSSIERRTVKSKYRRFTSGNFEGKWKEEDDEYLFSFPFSFFLFPLSLLYPCSGRRWIPPVDWFFFSCPRERKKWIVRCEKWREGKSRESQKEEGCLQTHWGGRIDTMQGSWTLEQWTTGWDVFYE